LVLGVVLALAGHALALGAAFVAGRIVEPSAGGGFEDLATVVVTFVGVEVLVALVCLVGGIALIGRRRDELGFGLIVGWALGALATWAFIGTR
jgi:hypothetical protein